MKSFMAKSEEVGRNWYLVDAENKTLGRLATRIATILRGKHKPEFTPHADTGDFVVVINADKVRLTGKKLSQKRYYWHTSYPGGLKSVTAGQLMKDSPEEVLRSAVWGMLPKNKWQKKLIKRVKIYSGSNHPHAAQQPKVLEV